MGGCEQVASCDIRGKPRQFERELLLSKVDKVLDLTKQLAEANKVGLPKHYRTIPGVRSDPRYSWEYFLYRVGIVSNDGRASQLLSSISKRIRLTSLAPITSISTPLSEHKAILGARELVASTRPKCFDPGGGKAVIIMGGEGTAPVDDS